MQHQNILEPSLQMRGQSPVNCPDSDVKEWGLNIRHSLYDEWPNGLIPLLDVVNKCKSIKDIGIYNDRLGLKIDYGECKGRHFFSEKANLFT